MKRIFNYTPLSGLLAVFALNACTYEVIPEAAACPELPVLELTATTEANCGTANGALSVAVVNPAGSSFIFKLNELENTDGVFTGLTAGNYSITVENEEGCTSSIDAVIKNKDGVNITTKTKNASCGSNNGSITIATEGGVEPLQFRIDTNDFQSTNVFNGLAQGKYQVLVKDANGCEVSSEVEITSDVVFSDVKALISQNCATASCHGGNVSPDFRQDGNIVSRASSIQSRTGSKSMPPPSSGKSLSDSQIQQIACWVNDGANQ
ncbi:hypothetical protein GCM10011506_05060 [Marivirga lumbricoides]|uniref:Cytochrome C Planctomycete-type domain-containing protein n=1 Tax=Marivirga lumbricoides TaxID=1046115 RepID=A0ABQ1LEV8_9BACT|nr:hypothetical protein GCM10011506_05060 [Marivirga lumbricoides]